LQILHALSTTQANGLVQLFRPPQHPSLTQRPRAPSSVTSAVGDALQTSASQPTRGLAVSTARPDHQRRPDGRLRHHQRTAKDCPIGAEHEALICVYIGPGISKFPHGLPSGAPSKYITDVLFFYSLMFTGGEICGLDFDNSCL